MLRCSVLAASECSFKELRESYEWCKTHKTFFDLDVELKKRLLNCDERLAHLRLRIVPARMNEDTFWKAYSHLLVQAVERHVTNDQLVTNALLQDAS